MIIGFIKNAFSFIIDVLFPRMEAERLLFLLSKEEAYTTLPRSPAPPVPKCRSIFAYKDDRVSKLIWNIKYKRNTKALDIGSYALYQELKATSPLLLLPIPVSRKRRRERGYNQCELLLDGLKKLDRAKLFQYNYSLLERAVHRDRQTLKNRAERIEGGRDIFAVNDTALEDLRSKTGNFSNVRTIVVDDVITTGSTMKSALETLERAGFKQVNGLSLAH